MNIKFNNVIFKNTNFEKDLLIFSDLNYLEMITVIIYNFKNSNEN